MAPRKNRGGRPKLPTSKGHKTRRLRKALREHGLNIIDKRTALWKNIEAREAAIAEDLGGFESLSAQRRILLSMVMRSLLMLESLDHWALQQPSIINKRARKLFPFVLERARLADSLLRQLEALGLDRQRAERRISPAEYMGQVQP